MGKGIITWIANKFILGPLEVESLLQNHMVELAIIEQGDVHVPFSRYRKFISGTFMN